MLILGQEQDEPGGLFSSLESFRGKMSRLSMWTKTLRGLKDVREGEDNAEKIMNECQEVRGDVFTWADVQQGINGYVKVTLTGQNLTVES